MCTMMAGVILVVLGLTGLGTAVKFIPRPIVIGFTNGIALLIASTQIKDFFGLKIDKVPGEFTGPHGDADCGELPHPRRGQTRAGRGRRWPSFVLFMRFLPRVPGHDRGAVRRRPWPRRSCTCRSRPSARASAAFPPGCPPSTFPHFTSVSSAKLLSPALTVAMLGAIESSAVGRGGRPHDGGDKHNPNTELFAQGIANIVVADLRRPARNRRHRPYGHQHPFAAPRLPWPA